MRCQPANVTNTTPDPLEAIVQSYLDVNATQKDRYLQYYQIQRNLSDAITKSAMAELPGGGRFSHQWRIPASVLTEAKDRLLKADFTGIGTFEELFILVRRTIGVIPGVGALTVYDTAHRIGAFLKLRPVLFTCTLAFAQGQKRSALITMPSSFP